MRDVELYWQLLGLAPPWTVTRVELNVKDQRVDVWADHSPGSRWPCPECGQELAVYDHSQERSWRQAKGERVAARIGVDEKAAAKGMKYLTLVYDIDRAMAECIADDRRQESLDGFSLGLSDKQLRGIEAVAMDMWPAYINSTLAHVPGAADKIVFD